MDGRLTHAHREGRRFDFRYIDKAARQAKLSKATITVPKEELPLPEGVAGEDCKQNAHVSAKDMEKVWNEQLHSLKTQRN